MFGYREALEPIDILALPKQLGTYIPDAGRSREIAIVCASTASVRHHRYSVIESKETFIEAIKQTSDMNNWIDGLHTCRFY